MANHLVGEASRYLQQHADNPVDWYPWGDVAFAKARAEDKPIFLSIGYSACHWCHVMAHESFEDAETAAFLNAAFVSIKVDREERPDLDRIYMGAVQALTGSGGWPMTVFTTPEGEPFYGGTYFPRVSFFGTPSFLQVLHAIADAWIHRRQELVVEGQRLVSALQKGELMGGTGADPLDPHIVESAYHVLRAAFDSANGGWGGAPKFPQPMVLEFLLRYYRTTDDDQALAMVTQTLEAMARGGLYDQLGGGFHRYAVDARWVTPHFEKMLYDNALMARVYLHGWQMTANRDAENGIEKLSDLFRMVVEETLAYVIREMTAPEGGFYATQDADTDGEEGKAYVWTPGEIRGTLGGSAIHLLERYGVTEGGNFAGKTILTFSGTVAEREALAGARRMLLAERQGRTRPGRDDKVLASWNGLMLAAFAEAAVGLDRGDALAIAERNAAFLLASLRDREGRLCHVWKDGKATVPGFLEDYACLIEGLLALYQATFEARWLLAALDLAETMIAHFGAPDGGFYDTGDDHEALVLRPRDLQDNATPSGNAMAATVLLKLAGFTHDARYSDLAHDTLARMLPMIGQHPLAFGQWLQALTYALARPREIAIVGDPAAIGTQALLAVTREGYRPFQVVALGAPDAQSGVPLLQGRDHVEGHAAAYVCRDATCHPPVIRPAELRARLEL